MPNRCFNTETFDTAPVHRQSGDRQLIMPQPPADPSLEQSKRIDTFEPLLQQVRDCKACASLLPHAPHPIVQLDPRAKILIASQAPGRKAHESGIPFRDASGERLRRWLGMSDDDFYDASKVAILPMGFCYPGYSKSGDLPPLPQCAATWHQQLLPYLSGIELTVLIGQYAQAYHLGERHRSVTHNVQAWQQFWPDIVPLPHPSPRNGIWLRKNAWFETEVIPQLQARVASILQSI